MAMLIAGWFSLGASERGAFGFSNEKSLMYCPSTLSEGACCCGCGVGPPLVVVMIRYPPSPAGIPHRAAWLTQGARPDKDHESVCSCPASEVHESPQHPLTRTSEAKGTSNSMILVPLFDLKFLIEFAACVL